MRALGQVASALLGSLGPLALGAVCGYLLLAHVLLDRLDLGETQRIVDLGRHLDRPAPARWLPFIGDSIVRDGIDGAAVAERLGGAWQVENLGVSGCSLTERHIILPAILARNPRAVGIGLYPTDLCQAGGLGIDEAHAYALAGFVARWPAGFVPGGGSDLSPDRIRALYADGWRLRLAFRTLVRDWLEYRGRLAVRADLRASATTDWIRPYTRLSSIRGPRLRAHLDTVRADLLACPSDARTDNSPGASPVGRHTLAMQVAEIRATGAVPVLVLMPVHPDLRAAAAPLAPGQRRFVQTLASRHDAPLLDAADLLGAEHFADAVHANAAGRARLSRWLGRQLKDPLGQQSGRQPGRQAGQQSGQQSD